MNRQYLVEMRKPIFHLQERNLLKKIFEERTKGTQEAPCEIELVLLKSRSRRKDVEAVFGMAMQQGDDMAILPKRLVRRYRIKLHDGWLVLMIQVCREQALAEAEIALMKNLVVDMAETLKLFANGDCFMKIGVEKLVQKIAAEIGTDDPAEWVRAYLAKPPYMERPEVRRYYRLYNRHLNHAKPQNLLGRTAEMLVETPV